jgi:hypothetical protein
MSKHTRLKGLNKFEQVNLTRGCKSLAGKLVKKRAEFADQLTSHYLAMVLYPPTKKVSKVNTSRLRYCIWNHWKKKERKRKNLIRLGVNSRDAFRWSRSRLRGWAIAQSPILNTTITVNRLGKRGYESMLAWYQRVAPHKFTPTLFPIV